MGRQSQQRKQTYQPIQPLASPKSRWPNFQKKRAISLITKGVVCVPRLSAADDTLALKWHYKERATRHELGSTQRRLELLRNIWPNEFNWKRIKYIFVDTKRADDAASRFVHNHRARSASCRGEIRGPWHGQQEPRLHLHDERRNCLCRSGTSKARCRNQRKTSSCMQRFTPPGSGSRSIDSVCS